VELLEIFLKGFLGALLLSGGEGVLDSLLVFLSLSRGRLEGVLGLRNLLGVGGDGLLGFLNTLAILLFSLFFVMSSLGTIGTK
jgi:hypothetical protein